MKTYLTSPRRIDRFTAAVLFFLERLDRQARYMASHCQLCGDRLPCKDHSTETT